MGISIAPEWSTDDIDWLIASREYEASIGPHGHPLDEATSSDANPANPDAKYLYVADDLPELDHARRAEVTRMKAWREGLPQDFDTAGYFFRVRKVLRT